MNDTQEFNQLQLYLSLPNITSLKQFLSSNESKLYQKSDNSSWIDLCLFVSYNISCKKMSLINKIEDLQLFSYTFSYLSILDQFVLQCQIDLYYRILYTFLIVFIQIIEKEDFIIYKDDNCILFFDILQVYEKVEDNYSSHAQMVFYAYEDFKQILYEKVTLIEINKYINHNNEKSFIDYFKLYDSLIFVSTISDNVIRTVDDYIRYYSDKETKAKNKAKTQNNGNMFKKQACKQSKKSTKQYYSQIKHISKPKIKSKVKRLLNTFCEESYCIQSQYANSSSSLKHYGNEYSFILIGSNSLGLNNDEDTTMDFVMLPKNNVALLYIDEIVSSRIVSLNHDNYLVIHNSTTNGVLFGAVSLANSNRVMKSVIYIGREKYWKCNRLLKTFFPKQSTLAKMHIFLNPLLHLYCGAQLSFLILAFFDRKYRIFTDIKCYYTCSFPVQMNNNVIYFEERTFWYYELHQSRYNQAIRKDIGLLLDQFIKYYYKLYQRHTDKNFKKSMGHLLNPEYFFTIWRVIEDFKQFDKGYWLKIKTLCDYIEDDMFSCYESLEDYMLDDE